MLEEKFHQTNPTRKITQFNERASLISPQMLDEMFGDDQTSSNTIFSSFFEFSFFFQKFELTQTVPTFHPISEKRHVGWIIGSVCSGLDTNVIPFSFGQGFGNGFSLVTGLTGCFTDWFAFFTDQLRVNLLWCLMFFMFSSVERINCLQGQYLV